MKRLGLTTTLLATILATGGVASEPALKFIKLWTFNHGTTEATLGQPRLSIWRGVRSSPPDVSFVDMLLTDGDLAPEGLAA